MRTVRAPATALSGKNISEDSLVISTAILAAPYAVLQPDSSEDPGSSSAAPKESRDGEPIGNAMAPDEAASALGSLDLERVVTSSFFMNSIGEVGGGLFVGVNDDEGLRRKWRMAEDRTTKCRSPLPPLGD